MISLTVFSSTSRHVETANLFPKSCQCSGPATSWGRDNRFGLVASKIRPDREDRLDQNLGARLDVGRFPRFKPGEDLIQMKRPAVSRWRFAGKSSFDISELYPVSVRLPSV